MSGSLEDAASSHLNNRHRQQVVDYLKYFRTKREQHLREMQRTFDEVKDTRLLEDVYTHEDVVDIFDALQVLLKSNTSDELANFTHTSVLFIRQLFLQAEGHNIQLRIDTSKLDDEVLLKDIDQMDSVKEATVNIANLPPPSKVRLGAISGGVVDTNLVTQIKELTAENARSQQRIDALKAQLAELSQKNSKLDDQLAHQDAELRTFKDGASRSSPGEAAQLTAQLAEARAELADTRKLLDAKVSATTQFQELRKIVARKNAQIKTMKARLAEVDPSFSMDSIA
ncbi:Leucine zipper transcription factor-like protein 1 [Plasmodiophora brassicae]|uniref:Leucine zipper transcription factor-like protein 1 n=1 Tax=Plasmodiophora brassicae TaxID=37360 RepID=A0A0G4II64_PLABS|nr:hypothetical protein PBRA_003711 [Plasmodiophora brassicae]SPQ94232.1 unnamed protein product [Plasmodiophora brassicae]